MRGSRVAAMDELAVERLLSEQRRYYGARAPEYDDWWFRRARYRLDAESAEGWCEAGAEVEGVLARFAPRGEVLADVFPWEPPRRSTSASSPSGSPTSRACDSRFSGGSSTALLGAG